jgi:hypothetical protein
MIQIDVPPSVPRPSMRRRRWWPSILLGMLSLLLLWAGGTLGGDTHNCCAIECRPGETACLQRELERAREHQRRRESARKTAMAVYAGSAVALGGAVLLLARR